jgi:hypothetical protein
LRAAFDDDSPCDGSAQRRGAQRAEILCGAHGVASGSWALAGTNQSPNFYCLPPSICVSKTSTTSTQEQCNIYR